MHKDSTFYYNGCQYEVMQSGLDFKEGKKACIRPDGEKRCIPIDKAVKRGLVRSLGVASSPCATPPSEDLFARNYPENKNAAQKKKAIAVTEPAKSYVDETLPPRQPSTLRPVCIAPQNCLYMPVDALRAQVFLGHGLIYPSLYDSNGMSDEFNDVQSHSPANLTLFMEMPPITKEQLILQVLVTQKEMERAINTGKTIRLQSPLPISRLIKILVPGLKNDLDLAKYIAGWIKPDIPTPAHLFEIMPVSNMQSYIAESSNTVEQVAKPQKSVTDSIMRYNRLMGLFAFLRNAHRFISAATGFYSDYPDEFFVLAASLFENATVFPKTRSPLTPLDHALLDPDSQIDPKFNSLVELVNSAEPFVDKEKARNIARAIYERAGSPPVLAHAFKQLFDGDYRSAVRAMQTDGIPTEATLLAGLFKFSSRQSNDHRNVKNRLHEEWTNATLISQFLEILGYYYGYTALDASEKPLSSIDPMIAPLADRTPSIKFQLTTRLERSVIEAVYQWTFFHRKLDEALATSFANAPVPTIREAQVPNGFLLKDLSLRVGDLYVRRFEITQLARLLQRLRSLPGEVIDERSEVGRYLFGDCFDIADESDVVRRKGQLSRRFRMSKSRLCELISDQHIKVNTRVLDVCISEDVKDYPQ